MTKKELKELIREMLKEELVKEKYLAEAKEQILKAPITKYTAFSYDEVAAKVAAEVFENTEFKKVLSGAIDNTIAVYDEDVIKLIEDRLIEMGVSEKNLETVVSKVCDKLEDMTASTNKHIADKSTVQTVIKKAGNIGGKRIG